MKKLCVAFIALIVFGSVAILQGMAHAADEPQKHLVPADKGLSKQTIERLYERGKRQVYAGKDLETIGMPVGGIGAGQLYLRGDGTLACWQIFNRHIFSGYGSQNYRTYRPDSPVDSGFAVIVEKDGKTLAKTLDRDFGTVEFAGEYPLGLVRYRDEGFPLSISMQASSPFIPLNAKDSALPATLFSVTVRNTSGQAVRAGLVDGSKTPCLLIQPRRCMRCAEASSSVKTGAR